MALSVVLGACDNEATASAVVRPAGSPNTTGAGEPRGDDPETTGDTSAASTGEAEAMTSTGEPEITGTGGAESTGWGEWTTSGDKPEEIDPGGCGIAEGCVQNLAGCEALSACDGCGAPWAVSWDHDPNASAYAIRTVQHKPDGEGGITGIEHVFRVSADGKPGTVAVAPINGRIALGCGEHSGQMPACVVDHPFAYIEVSACLGPGTGECTEWQTLQPEQVPQVCAACKPTTTTHATVAPLAVLVVDRSSRMMTRTWDHDADPQTPAEPHWSAVRSALAPWAIAHGNGKALSLGLAQYPGAGAQLVYNSSACKPAALDVFPGANNGQAIAQTLPAADAILKGATATASGLAAALESLGAPGVPRAMILISNAAPNCGHDLPPPPLFEQHDTAAAAVAAGAFATGIETHVIAVGSPAQLAADTGAAMDGYADDVSPLAALDSIAAAGGTTSARPAHDQADIAAALDDIAADLRSCTVIVPGLAAPGLVSVDVAWQPVAPLGACVGDGWVRDGDVITLCGAACSAAKVAGEIEVHTACE